MKLIIKNDNRDIVKNPNVKIIETTEASFANQTVFIEENDVPIIKYTDTESMYFVKDLDNLYDRKSRSEVLINISGEDLELIGGGGSNITKTSELENDGEDGVNPFITLHDLPEPPTTPTKTSDLTNDGSDATSTYAETDELGATAFSNDYNDLDNLPTIPNNLEELHNVTETNYTTPINTDSVLTFDVTNSLWKRLSWENIKSNLKTYFDTLYVSLSIFNDFQTAVFSSLDNKLDKSSTPSSVYGTNTAGGQTMIPFSTLQSSLGFTPENVANKATDFTIINDTLYPSVEAVKDYVDANSNSFIEKSSNLNITVTGTSVETLLYTKNLGIINNTNLLTIKDLLVTQDYNSSITNSSGNITLRLRISDSPTLPTDFNSIIATLNIPSNANTFDGFAKMERTFTFTQPLGAETYYTIICPPPNVSYNTDIINSFGYKWNVFGQLANNKYLFITVELPSATNSCTLRSLLIQKL